MVKVVDFYTTDAQITLIDRMDGSCVWIEGPLNANDIADALYYGCQVKQNPNPGSNFEYLIDKDATSLRYTFKTPDQNPGGAHPKRMCAGNCSPAYKSCTYYRLPLCSGGILQCVSLLGECSDENIAQSKAESKSPKTARSRAVKKSTN